MTRKEDAGMAEGRVRMWRRWGRECGEVRGRDAALVLCSARFPLGGGNDEMEGSAGMTKGGAGGYGEERERGLGGLTARYPRQARV